MSHATTSKSSLYGIVNRVVDSFDIRVYRDNIASTWLDGALDEIRKALNEPKIGQSEYITLPGLGTWEIKHSGKLRSYEFSLKNRMIGDIYVWKPSQWRSKQVADTGQLYISFRSVYLQQGGIPRALDFVNQLASLLFSPTRLLNPDSTEFMRISRVDLAVDYEDRRVLTMNKAQKQQHNTISWADLDLYQTRGKRTKREAMLTPWNGSAKENITSILRRSRQNSKFITDKLKALGLHSSPPYDNRGGHCDTNQQNGFEGDPSQFEIRAEQNAVLHGDDATAIALENMVILLADTLVESLESDGKAQVTRVIGSRKPQTIYLGRFGGDLYAREYFKQATLVAQNKNYMVQTWLDNGWNPECPVWRLEFSLAGDFLRQFVDTVTGERVDLRDPNLFLEWIPRVWTYLTRTWARHTVWSKDENRSRWQPSERWRTLQNAWTSTDAILRLKRPPDPSLDGLTAGMIGYSKSIAAKLSAVPEIRAKALETCGFKVAPKSGEDRKKYWAALTEAAKSEVLNIISASMYDEENQSQYDADMLERQASFGIDDNSDAAISSLLRSERMREGDGS